MGTETELVSKAAVNKILYDGYQDHLHHCTNSVNAAQFIHGLQQAVIALPPSDAEQLSELRSETLKGICVYCGEIQQYKSLEQKSGEEGNQIRIAHIRQCPQRPGLKLIAYCKELQRTAQNALHWFESRDMGRHAPFVVADLRSVLTPKQKEKEAR